VVLVVPVGIRKSVIELLVGNRLLKRHKVGDRHTIGEACLTALEKWAGGDGARSMDSVRARRRGLAVIDGRTTPSAEGMISEPN